MIYFKDEIKDVLVGRILAPLLELIAWLVFQSAIFFILLPEFIENFKNWSRNLKEFLENRLILISLWLWIKIHFWLTEEKIKIPKLKELFK